MLDGAEWSVSHPSCFIPGTNWTGGQVGHQNQPGCFGREKSLYPARIQTVDHPAYSLVAIPTALSWCQDNIFIVNGLLTQHQKQKCKLHFTSSNIYDPGEFYLSFHYMWLIKTIQITVYICKEEIKHMIILKRLSAVMDIYCAQEYFFCSTRAQWNYEKCVI